MAYAKKTKKSDEGPSGYEILKADLKNKQPGRFYIFHGEENYLRSHYLGLLKKQILSGPAEDFNFHRFTQENMNLDALQDAVEAIPMMAERSMIQVDDYDLFKLNESDRERMVGILSDLPDYCCLVFYYETVEFSPDKRQKKLWGVISSNATIAEFEKQQGRELVAWIRRHFMRQKKDIDDRLAQYLIYITGGTMTALASEIEKICSYAEGQIIQRTDIDAVVEPVLDAIVFNITDAITEGDYGLALSKLQTLIKMQEKPLVILGAIGSQMRWLRCAKMLSANGKGKESLMALCGMKEYPARKAMSAAAHISMEFCDKAVVLCAETDYRMKTSYDDPQRMLELLLLQLAEEARRG